MIYLLDSIAFVHVTNEYYDSSSPQNAASTVLDKVIHTRTKVRETMENMKFCIN